MFDLASKGTIQEMALNVIEEKRKTQSNKNVSKEQTIFVLGSKGAVNIKFFNVLVWPKKNYCDIITVG